MYKGKSEIEIINIYIQLFTKIIIKLKFYT